MYLKNNITDKQFIEKLKDCIKNDTPFCFSRFGDGEIYFINNNVPDKIKNLLKSTWGYEDVDMGIKEVLKTLNVALVESDVIGLMNAGNKISEHIRYTDKAWSIKIDYIKKIGGKNVLVADHMIARSNSLGNIKEFKNIIQGKNIAIVSPRANLLKKNRIHDILGVNVNYIEVPMGIKIENRKPIFDKLDTIKEPIVLYGCSITGKDFGVYLRNRGKIALDFGATLDAWSGLVTRKWFKEDGLQNYCTIKKTN